MKIRKMTEEEYLACEKIYSPDPLLDPSAMPFDEEKTRRAYKNLRNTFGIFVDEKIVGYLSLKPSGEIGVLILNDNLKRKGYGTLAVKNALIIAENNGIKTVFAQTDGNNVPMKKILINLGFTLTEKFTKIIPPSTHPRTFLRYEKQISIFSGLL